jgi:hypothetical protein
VKTAWVSTSPISVKASTITQISAGRRTPRRIWMPGRFVAAAARMPPACRAASATTKAAKNQKRIMTTMSTL